MNAGWQKTTLGAAFTTVTGNTPPKNNADFYGQFMPLVKPPELCDVTLDSAEDGLSEAGAEVARTAPPNSILVSCIGNLGKVGLNTIPVAFNQQINAILPDDRRAIPEFMFYQVLSSSFKEQLEALASGTTVPIVNKSKFNSIEIVLPPLPEQQRIVAILDEAFDGIATAKANAEKNLQNARALFESHLQSVFTQRGEGWPIRKLGELSDHITDGTHNSPPYVETGIPMLDSKHVKDGFVIDDTEPEKFISPATDVLLAKRCKPRTGDILISSRGSIGKIAIVREGQDFNIMGNMILIRLPAGVNREFAAFYLHSQVAHIDSIARGVAQKGLYLNQIREYELPLPSEAKQGQIGKQLDALSAETQRLESIYQRKLAALASLKKSLLHQAFSGQL